MSSLDWELFPNSGRVLGRVVAIGFCPRCGPGQSVTISQPVLEWKDKAQTQPLQYGLLEMECGTCGAGIEDVEFPLDETKWQLLLEAKPKAVKPARDSKVIAMPAVRRKAAAL